MKPSPSFTARRSAFGWWPPNQSGGGGGFGGVGALAPGRWGVKSPPSRGRRSAPVRLVSGGPPATRGAPAGAAAADHGGRAGGGPPPAPPRGRRAPTLHAANPTPPGAVV